MSLLLRTFFEIPPLKADATHEATPCTHIHTQSEKTNIPTVEEKYKKLKTHFHYNCGKPCFFTVLGQGFIQAVLLMPFFVRRLVGSQQVDGEALLEVQRAMSHKKIEIVYIWRVNNSLK